MVIVLDDVLTATEASDLRDSLHGYEYAEDLADPQDSGAFGEAEGAALMQALQRHPLFVLAIQPSWLSAVRFSCQKHDLGEQSEVRVPSLPAEPIWTDVAVTVFLSNPRSYEGGELIIDTGYGDQAYKVGAGSCVAFPISSRSYTAAVTRGERWVGELSVRSLIRDEREREILYDVSSAERFLEIFQRGSSQELERLRRCREELLRMWAER
jgi:PKHD-type hydroxylase